MPELIVDLTNFKDRVGRKVDEGRYTVVVEDAELDKSKAGNAMVNLWLRVQGGKFDGATIIDRLTMTEKALFRVVNFMQALGMKTPNKKLKLNTSKFIGQKLQIDVEDGEPYMGRVKSEVRGYLQVEKSAKDEDSDLEDLDEGDGDDEEDEAEEADAPDPEPKAKKKKKKAAPVEDDDDDDDDDPEEVDLDSLDLG